MNDERFTIAYGGNVIGDTLEKKAYQTSSCKEDVESVVMLLNKFHQKNNEKGKLLVSYIRQIDELKKEKKELQEKLSNAIDIARLNQNDVMKFLAENRNLIEENEQLRQQQQRLYNYFRDYLEDEMSAENFSEMWDTVKVDERW